MGEMEVERVGRIGGDEMCDCCGCVWTSRGVDVGVG
jgi:hypothetical protein